MNRCLYLVLALLPLLGCDSGSHNDTPHFADITFESVLIEGESPPNIENGIVYSRVSLQTLLAVDGPPDLVEHINAIITKMLVGRPTYEAFMENYLPDEHYKPRFNAPNFSGSVSLVRRSPNMLTLKFYTFDLNLCGASCSGAIKVRYANIDDSGRMLSLSDVITDTDEFFTRTKKHVERIQHYYGVSPRSYFLPPDWYITQNEKESYITLQFQAYEVSVGAAGNVALPFPVQLYEDLRVPRYWVRSYDGELLSDFE